MKLLQIVAAVPGAVGETDRYYKESLRLLVPAMYQEYEYDADGNMISDGLYKYEYDGEDRLKAVYTHPLAVTYGVPYKRSDYVYDYMGRRIGKKETGVGGVFVKDTRYVYNGWNVQIEFSMSKSGGRTWSRTYSWGLDVSVSLTGAGGVGALLQVYDHIEKKTYLPMYDGNGNVMGMLNHGTGLLEAVYEYGPFGETIRATGGYAKKNVVRYSTKWTDDESGLVYYGRRYYSPELGRFINRDPIEEKGGLNLYGFCGNNAINSFDILGMRTWTHSTAESPGVNEYDDESNWGTDGDGEFYNFDAQNDEDAKICAQLKSITQKEYEFKGCKEVTLKDGSKVTVRTYGVADQAKKQEDANRATPSVEVVTGTKSAVQAYKNTVGTEDKTAQGIAQKQAVLPTEGGAVQEGAPPNRNARVITGELRTVSYIGDDGGEYDWDTNRPVQAVSERTFVWEGSQAQAEHEREWRQEQEAKQRYYEAVKNYAQYVKPHKSASGLDLYAAIGRSMQTSGMGRSLTTGAKVGIYGTGAMLVAPWAIAGAVVYGPGLAMAAGAKIYTGAGLAWNGSKAGYTALMVAAGSPQGQTLMINIRQFAVGFVRSQPGVMPNPINGAWGLGYLGRSIYNYSAE